MTVASTYNSRSNTQGAIYMMLSMAGFVLNDMLIKLVSGQLSLFQAILLRGLFACALMAILCWWMGVFKQQGGTLQKLSHPLVLLRTIGETGGTFFFLSALFQMPIANVTAVMQLLPLTITLGAALFLGEAVGWRRYMAIIVGLLGVMLIVKPGTEGFNWFSIYAVIAALFITLRDLATRRLPANIPSLLVSLVATVAVTVLGAVGSLFQPWHAVEAYHMMILSAAAAILMVGYVFSILTMRVGDVSFIAPFRYSILIWALIIGFFVFGDLPDGLSSIGAIIVVASGLYTFYREQLMTTKSTAT